MERVIKKKYVRQSAITFSMLVVAFTLVMNEKSAAQSMNLQSFTAGDANVATVAAAAESSDHGIPIHVSGVLGATTIYDHGTYFTTGLDILTKPFPNDHFDVGLLGEIIWADHTEYITGLFLGYTLSHELPVTFSYIPSFLFIEGESDFMHMAGISYAFHIGKLTLSPMVNLEFIHGHTNVMSGVGIGTHF